MCVLYAVIARRCVCLRQLRLVKAAVLDAKDPRITGAGLARAEGCLQHLGAPKIADCQRLRLLAVAVRDGIATLLAPRTSPRRYVPALG